MILRESQNSKSRSHDLFPSLVDLVLHFFVSAPRGLGPMRLKFLAFTHLGDMEVSHNFNSRSRDPFPTPLT